MVENRPFLMVSIFSVSKGISSVLKCESKPDALRDMKWKEIVPSVNVACLGCSRVSVQGHLSHNPLL